MDERTSMLQQVVHDLVFILELCPELDHPPTRQDLMGICKRYVMDLEEAGETGVNRERIEQVVNRVRPMFDRLLALDEETLASAFPIAKITIEKLACAGQPSRQAGTHPTGSAFFHEVDRYSNGRGTEPLTEWRPTADVERDLVLLAIYAVVFCALVLVCAALWEMIL